jgi:hypothetical protein
MTTQLENAKEALAQIGTRSKITSLSDGSAEAQYVNLLYEPIRDFLLTEGDWDFALAAENLVATTTPPFPWTYRYAYPVGALRIRQLIPTVRVVNDPRPVEWNVMVFGDDRVIVANQSMDHALVITQAVEETWNPIFQQSFVRMLASALAFALENRIEASKLKLDEALGFAGLGRARDM